MKKLLNILLIITIISTTALAGSVVTPGVEITQNRKNGNEFIFEISYILDKVNKGDSFLIEFPFEVEANGKDIFSIEQVGNSYKYTALDDYENVKGYLGGKRVAYKENLDPLVINGKAIEVDYQAPEQKPQDRPVATERDRVYKHGTIKGDIIEWEVVIGGDEKGVQANTHIWDEIGEGHEYVDGSLKFHVIENGTYNDSLVDMVVSNVATSSKDIQFNIEGLAPGEVLLFTYETKITDKSLAEYSNMVIVDGEGKVSESVVIESWGDVEGDKPNTPDEPEDPDKPDNPDEPEPENPTPELPPELPATGELFPWEIYIIGGIILIIGLYLRKE